ncbi:sialic acid synthase [Fimbriimonas ginsengisoli Gsoil 348]|uniref:Sialic acid synthase n=1 Tax=Fimbriimonas ginsengisoli Gsoil 348 TaxID=661478 RepID=A0A068NT07_FIMGI|nr:sialic acid synthase [Fimbriimonas ginsengisoli Gsoil 348]
MGCNHKGDLMIAKQMINVAASFSGVDVIKFQKRNPQEALSPNQYNSVHPVPENSYGQTYGAHREFLEFTVDQHRELKATCEENRVEYSSSVFDLTSAKEIASLNPRFIKIPSQGNLRFGMLEYLCDEYHGDMHVSFGMTTHLEEQEIVEVFVKKGRAKNLVIYSCTSGYPVAHEDLCLLEIVRLKNTYGSTVKEIGFSGHHNGIAADVAATTLGVSWIERHFTLDRTWKGTDHAASLEPDGLRRLVRDVRNVSKALEYKHQEILDSEMPNRNKEKYTAEKYVAQR